MRDFFETRQGACQVTAPLTYELAQTCRHWGQLVGKVAEELAARPARNEQAGIADTDQGTTAS